MQAVADQRAEIASIERARQRREAEAEAARLVEAERLRADQQRVYLEREAQRTQAQQRARELLLENLTEEQRTSFQRNNWFVVEGGRSRKKYRIHTMRVAGNIEGLDDSERVIERYCSHLTHDLPPHDHHLAQKLFIESHEDEFLRNANRTLMTA